jgi:tRNA modification GTPase
MELGQAEAVADLISAASEAAADLALEKLGGSQSSWMKDVAEQIRQVATYAEAGVDFSDQDLEEDSLEELRSKLDSPILGLETLERTFERGLRIQDGVRAAFVGLPNAGKSSFFNVLLGEDRSIVSEIEGTTRDIVRERLVLRGKRGSVALRLEDTAGLRASQDQVEQIGVERTRQAARQADVILLLWDGSREGAAAEEAFEALQAIWESLGKPKEKTLGIVTKADLGRESSDWLGRLGISWVGPVSSRSGEGVHEAAQRIADFAETWVSRKPGEILLTRRDHRESVLAALEHLRRARRAAGVELLASDLRQALLSLAPLIGETPPDDILGRIFSQFCIGK